jgi:hypothetical protein
VFINLKSRPYTGQQACSVKPAEIVSVNLRPVYSGNDFSGKPLRTHLGINQKNQAATEPDTFQKQGNRHVK